jgi:hypothetical protein
MFLQLSKGNKNNVKNERGLLKISISRLATETKAEFTWRK